jgi:hypothetical protein
VNLYLSRSAQVAELVDALASGASGCKVVKVRVLSWAPLALQWLKCLVSQRFVARSPALTVCLRDSQSRGFKHFATRSDHFGALTRRFG